MTAREHSEIIEKYLKGELPPEELARFEALLQQNDRLAEEVKEYELLYRNLKSLGSRKKLRKQLNIIHAEMLAEQGEAETTEKLPNGWSIFRNRTYSIPAVAASVAVLTFLASWLVFNALHQPLKQPAGYVELRREVKKLKQTQDAILQDIIGSEAVKPPVFDPGQFSGTGFALTSDGYLVTSFHVIEGADSLLIELKDGTRYKVNQIFTDEDNDLAILKIEDSAFTSFGKLPYSFRASESELGEKVFTLGFPREDVVYGEGSISALSGYNNDTTAYQISIPLNPGNSGGPLLDDKGNLIGVISGKQLGFEGAAFAVKSGYLLDLIKDQPETQNISASGKQNVLNGQTRPSQLKKLQDFVFMIKVYNQPE